MVCKPFFSPARWPPTERHFQTRFPKIIRNGQSACMVSPRQPLSDLVIITTHVTGLIFVRYDCQSLFRPGLLLERPVPMLRAPLSKR